MGIFDFFRRKTGAGTSAISTSSIEPSPLEWRKMNSHLLLLSRFVNGLDRAAVSPSVWSHLLREPPESAIARLTAEGMLCRATLAKTMETVLRVSDLKALLKASGLPSSGNKNVLIERLIAADRDAMALKFDAHQILECTEKGRTLAQDFLERQRVAREAALTSSFELVQKRDFKNASLVVAEHEAKQVFPRGVGIDWSEHDPSRDVRVASLIFESRPAILSELTPADWDPLRVATSMMQLWGEASVSRWLPESFVGLGRFDADTAARMLLFHAQHKLRISEFRAIHVRKATIDTCGEDSCEACRKFEGRSFELSALPELPHPGCTESRGCRCAISAVFPS
jgi:hypothetical protein